MLDKKIKKMTDVTQKHHTGNLDCSLRPLDFCMTLRFGKKTVLMMKKIGLMLHTLPGIRHHNVGRVRHFPLRNGQEKNTVNPYCTYPNSTAYSYPDLELTTHHIRNNRVYF